MKLLLLVTGLSSFGLYGCPVVPTEPPPPARKPGIPAAPPHAQGALAAGTDAAPKPAAGALTGDGEDSTPAAPAAPDAAAPDSGAPEAAPEPAPKAAPDAGMAL